ncbi:hypothetical protein JCM11491_002408 [Sporobolomyces phaffii]
MYFLRDERPAKPANVQIRENKIEIERLKKIVRQLETIIAEREVEREMYLPPTPPHDELVPEHHHPPRNTRELPRAPPVPRHRHAGAPRPPRRHYHLNERDWQLHVRASTWPQRAVPLASESHPLHQPVPPPPHDPHAHPAPIIPPFDNSDPTSSVPAFQDPLAELSQFLENEPFLDLPVPPASAYSTSNLDHSNHFDTSFFSTVSGPQVEMDLQVECGGGGEVQDWSSNLAGPVPELV